MRCRTAYRAANRAIARRRRIVRRLERAACAAAARLALATETQAA